MSPEYAPHPMTATSYFLLGMIAGVVIVLTMLGWIVSRTDPRRAPPDPAALKNVQPARRS